MRAPTRTETAAAAQRAFGEEFREARSADCLTGGGGGAAATARKRHERQLLEGLARRLDNLAARLDALDEGGAAPEKRDEPDEEAAAVGSREGYALPDLSTASRAEPGCALPGLSSEKAWGRQKPIVWPKCWIQMPCVSRVGMRILKPP